MDREGVAKILQAKLGRGPTAEEQAVLASLTVRDCVRLWEAVSFGAAGAGFDLVAWREKIVSEEAADAELTPARKKIIREVKALRDAVERLGERNREGLFAASFRQLHEDRTLRGGLDSTVAGVCKLARKEGLVYFDAPDLVLGKNDAAKIILVEMSDWPPKAQAKGGAGIERKKTDPVTEEELELVAAEIRRLLPSQGRHSGGKLKLPWGSLEVGAQGLSKERLPLICKAAKAKGLLNYTREELRPNDDAEVLIDLIERTAHADRKGADDAAARAAAEAEEEQRKRDEAEAAERAQREAEEAESRRQAMQRAKELEEEQRRQQEEEERRKREEAEERERKRAEREEREKREKEEREKREKEEQEARQREEEEAARRKQAEDEARKKAEEEAARQAEEAKRKAAEEEAKRKAEEEARVKAEEEAKRKLAEEARIRAEEEATKKREEEKRREQEAAEAKRKAEAEELARHQAEEAARQKAEEETRRQAEEARQKAEEDAATKKKADALAKTGEDEDIDWDAAENEFEDTNTDVLAAKAEREQREKARAERAASGAAPAADA